MIDNPLYRIISLTPRTDIAMGRYGFGIYLDRAFAQRARAADFGPETQQRMQDEAKSQILRKLFKEKYIHPPFMFVDDSALVQSFQVPGDACQLGIDYRTIEDLKDSDGRNLEFSPHNVDCMQQSFGLLCLFTQWVDWVEATIEPRR